MVARGDADVKVDLKIHRWWDFSSFLLASLMRDAG
jgi:hypothetical protein